MAVVFTSLATGTTQWKEVGRTDVVANTPGAAAARGSWCFCVCVRARACVCVCHPRYPVPSWNAPWMLRRAVERSKTFAGGSLQPRNPRPSSPSCPPADPQFVRPVLVRFVEGSAQPMRVVLYDADRLSRPERLSLASQDYIGEEGMELWAEWAGCRFAKSVRP